MKYSVIFLLLIPFSFQAFALEEFDYRNSGRIKPNDYLMGSHGERSDSVFDRYQTIDLSVDIGVGSDCGKLDLKSTMSAALKNIIDTKYLGSIGKDIVASSPMLLLAYWSPTWASIIKSARLRSQFLAQIRLDQCKAIDSYIDSRSEEHMAERAECVRKANQRSGGNFEESMESCKNYKDYDISSWSGDGKSGINKLVESTAKWAGFNDRNAQKIVNLTKALIGDTIIKKGSLSIDYGPRRVQLTPRTHLMELKTSTHHTLCNRLVKKIVNNGGIRASSSRYISDNDLNELNKLSNRPLIDRQTIQSLIYLPHLKREVACKKLADSMAMTIFTDDMGKSLDFVSSKMTTNPHLPEKRKEEAVRKARVLKNQIEMTLALEKNNSDPLNEILYTINKEGAKYQQAFVEEDIDSDQAANFSRHIDTVFFDCADGIECH